jgi:hypothetical protein
MQHSLVCNHVYVLLTHAYVHQYVYAASDEAALQALACCGTELVASITCTYV